MRAAVTLGAILCVLTAGCGQSATEKATANLSKALNTVAMDEAYSAMMRDYAHPARIAVDLNRYRLAAHVYAGEVGRKRAATKLARDASAIESTCQECADSIDRIRETLD